MRFEWLPQYMRRVAFGAAALLISTLAGCGLQPYASSEQSLFTTGAVSPPAPRTRGAVVAQPGDTLSAIARRYNVTVYDLMTINNLSSQRIASGQTLYLPPY